MKKRKDKYDRAIEYLTKHPEKIAAVWIDRDYHTTELKRAHALFEICGIGDEPFFGCLTQIRRHELYIAATPELTMAIRRDRRIPRDEKKIKVSDLPVFAEWQRRLDKELNRK